MSAPLYEDFCLETDEEGWRCHPGTRPFGLWGIPDGAFVRFREAAAMEIVEQTERICALALRAGREQPCPGAECPLWENGECALERLTTDGELVDEAWPDDARPWHRSGEGGGSL